MARRVSLHRGRVSLLVVLVALALTSLACGIGGMFAPDPTPEPTVEPTAEPTVEPTDEPTSEPTPEPTEEPTQASASGGVKDDGTPSTGPTASLEIINNSSFTVCYLYVSPSEDTEWGDDQLGSDIVASGTTFTLTDIPAGTYDLRADDCEGNILSQEFGVVLESGSYPWTFSDSGVTFTIVNNSSVDLCWVYLSPSTDDEWGPDQLGSEILHAGESWVIMGLEAGMYDLRIEACGEGELEDYGLNVSGDFEYTVTD